ncbi:1-acyl-sn-glycerol-3-phosphate acyltransferase [Tamilnaduibacter salinus]|uniref:1-acyl-sn-glycerol-3-phosphate acyltransferase n=1 Tax=Tamilnaduibacter salinus TaxID=1484056 RepID=A0A2A2I5W9_9GAMM|nr:1-acylglycerol-3-phosphate O-acyltransferase [Tamilnaduibacter salinus]PAV27129.1 1-acyl-sn-glycerol-3-phosphate acyltransferase [Tamilnaduibacter salinus]PVY79042.1 1-acyl-sn-glycerol-3-phosphate acyltransferase [Tamilnaduibacter salinus]
MRSFLAWVYSAIGSLIGFCLCLVRPFNPDNNRINARMLASGGQRLLNMQVDVEGREYLADDTPRIVIANHQHNEDLFVMGNLLPPRTVTVGKSSLRWLPFFGQMFWLGGNVLVNRRKGSKAVAVINATAEAMRRDGKSVWIFPEGTRSHGKGLRAFRKGAFHAAVAAGVPITMVCVSEYQGATGHGRGEPPVRVRVLPPVDTAGMTADDVPSLLDACHARMKQTIDDLTHRLPSPA